MRTRSRLQCATSPLLVPNLAEMLPDSMLLLPWVERELLDRLNPLLYDIADAVTLPSSAGWNVLEGWSWIIQGPMENAVDGNDRLIERLNRLRSGTENDKRPTTMRPSDA